VYLKRMKDDPHKFLGSNITERNTPADHFAFLKDKLKVKLTNFEKSTVRGEFKVAVNSRYILPSLQFHFSVHSIHKTHLDVLDGMARKFLKSWLSFPTSGVTDIGIFHPGILGLKYPSQVYLEAHMTSFISLKLTEDPIVKEAVDCQLQCEGVWTKKSSTAMKCQEIFESINTTHAIPARENCDNYIGTKRMEIARFKKAAKAVIASRYLEQTNNKSIQLKVQGHLATLLIQEESNMAGRASYFQYQEE
jgi:hypothetical protein